MAYASPMKIANGLVLDFTVDNADTANDTFLGLNSSGEVTKFATVPRSRVSGGGNITEATSSVLTITGGTGAALTSGLTIQVLQAGAAQSGYLSTTDWNTFNNKLSSSLTSAYIYVGNGSNVATGVALSGDISITNTGNAQIVAGAILDADVNGSASIAFSKMAALTASRILASNGSGVVSILDTATYPSLTELSYSKGVTSALQTQINSKLSVTLTGVASGDVITYNGSAWVNTPSSGTGIPTAGTTNQILRKINNTNYNVEWHTLVAADLTDLTSSASELNKLTGVTTTATQFNFLNTLSGDVQSQLAAKLSTSLTQNYMLVGDASNIAVGLAPGTNGYVLTSVSGVPTWVSPGVGGTVTSVAASGGTTGMSFTGSPITTTGTLTLTGTLALANGGTGASLADPGADRIMFWDDSAGAVTWLTAGNGLTITTTTLSGGGTLSSDITYSADGLAHDFIYTSVGPGSSGQFKVYVDATSSILLSGATSIGGLLSLTASGTSAASLNVPHGTAPSSPVNGDVWSTTSGFYGRVNGVTSIFGNGDMVLASSQTNSGTKTFLNGSFKLRNVANTFDAIFSNTNTADRTYTLPDISGTSIIGGGGSVAWSGGTSWQQTNTAADFDITTASNSPYAMDIGWKVVGSGSYLNGMTTNNNGAYFVFLSPTIYNFTAVLSTGLEFNTSANNLPIWFRPGTGGFRIYNPANTFYYTIGRGAIAANRTISLPLLTGDDTFVAEAFTQTLTNKTLGSGTAWTVAPTITDGLRITFNPDGTNSGLNVGSHTADPSSPTNGDIYYDSVNNLLRARINSAWVSLGAGGSGITGSTGSVDNAILRADGTGGATLQSSEFTISDAGDITMGISGSTSGTDRYIYSQGSSANINIAIFPKGSGVLYLGGAAGIYVGGSVDFIDGDIALSSAMDTTLRAPSVSGNAYNLIIGAESSSAANGNGGHFYIDNGKKHGTGLDGNIGLLTSSVANWQSMERGVYLANRVTAPTAGLADGIAMFAEDVGSNSELFVYTESGAKVNVSGLIQSVVLSGTTLTLSETHRGKIIYCTSSSAITITIPASLQLGFNCIIMQDGSGTVTLNASAVTLNGKSATVGAQDTITLVHYKATDTYIGK